MILVELIWSIKIKQVGSESRAVVSVSIATRTFLLHRPSVVWRQKYSENRWRRRWRHCKWKWNSNSIKIFRRRRKCNKTKSVVATWTIQSDKDSWALLSWTVSLLLRFNFIKFSFPLKTFSIDRMESSVINIVSIREVRFIFKLNFISFVISSICLFNAK